MGGNVQPFLKWAGGKRWLTPSDVFPTSLEHGRYFEPFLGSAAMFFALQPRSAVLSDANADLIELYEVVRDQPGTLDEILKLHQERHSHEHYYSVRRCVPADKVHRAARMLYLNRTCWNGLYRVNLKGEFNVPIGTKTRVLMKDDFGALSDVLRGVELRCCDFAEVIREVEAGDLIFADPPYTVRHNANGFLKYNEQIFSWEDQVRLRDACLEASTRGAFVVVTNADHESVRELYRGIAKYRPLARKSVLAAHSAHRGDTTEAIFVFGGH
jgi:DNA adenine methylase